jgi:hypothetical protein
MPFNAAHHIFTYLQGQLEEMQPWRPRPSNDIEGCLRQSVYHASGVTPGPARGRMGLVFDDGHYWEEALAVLLEEAGFKVHHKQAEVTIPGSNPEMKGSIDYIVDFPTGPALVDAKALNPHTWANYEGEDPEQWPNQYMHQLGMYHLAIVRGQLGPELAETCKEAALFIKNKATGAILEYWYRWDGQWFIPTARYSSSQPGITLPVKGPGPLYRALVDANNARNAEVLRLVEHSILPEKGFQWGHWRCNYCRWSNHCYEGYERDTMIHPIAPASEAAKDTANKWQAMRKTRLATSKDEDAWRNALTVEMARQGAVAVDLGDGRVAVRIVGEKDDGGTPVKTERADIKSMAAYQKMMEAKDDLD